jgi:hypothetical protein
MASELKVILIYQNGWEAQALSDEEDRVSKNAPADWQFSLGYADLDDLIRQVGMFLTIDPDKPCLRLIEIDAHACPSFIDDIMTSNVAKVGEKFMKLKWCDAGDIYLSGCNTGLDLDVFDPNPSLDPIAKRLADAMPYDAAKFPHHITVHGTNGYMSGTHMQGNESTSKSYSTGHLWWAVDYPEYDDARDAKGNACWNDFKNGNW